MGQTNSKNIKTELQFNPNEWQLLTTNEFGAKCTNLYLHRRLRQWGQRTTVTCGPHHTTEQELSIYYYRMKQDNALVSVYSAQFGNDSKAPLCGNTQLVTVVYQRIPVRLTKLTPLNLPDSLYILSQSIRGFKGCYEKVGQFDITSDMIGFNSQGFVKVWLCQNFAQNHPSQQKIALQVTKADKFQQSSHRQQTDMLDNLLDVIQQKTEKGFPKQLNTALRQKQTFAQAYCQIERFCQEYDIWIPDRIPLSKYFGEYKGDHTHIAEFNNRAHQIPIYSNQHSQHASYIPNVKYQYPRRTYLTGTPTANNINTKERYVPIESSLKFSPIIYNQTNNRPASNSLQFTNTHNYNPIINYGQMNNQQAPSFSQTVYLTGRPN